MMQEENLEPPTQEEFFEAIDLSIEAALENARNNDKMKDELDLKPIHQIMVEKFMHKAGQDVPDVPTIPDLKTLKLRAQLMMEEVLETIDAMGLVITVESDSNRGSERLLDIDKLHFYKDSNVVDLVGVADGLADVSVVTYGTAAAFGIKMKPILAAVDENNLQKFAPGGYVNEAGKVIKPPNHKPPDIKKLLADQGWTDTQQEKVT